MKVYAVLGYDQYYPKADNVLCIFLSESRANEECEERRRDDGYHDFYDVVEWEILK